MTRGSPAVVSVGAVGLGHPLDVLLLLDGTTAPSGGVEELPSDPLDGGALGAGVASGDEPTQAQRLRAARRDLDRHLVGGATHAAAAHLDARLDVVERLTEHLEGLLAAALLDQAAGAVEDPAGGVLLAVAHELVDQRGDGGVGVDQVRLEAADFSASSASHVRLLPCLRLLGAVLAAALVALDVTADADALGVERAADDVVTDAREVLDTAAADEDHGVLLEVVLLARDVGGDLLAAGEADTRDLAEGRVRLLRGLGLDGGADAAALGRTLQGRRLALLGYLLAPLAEQLVNGRQNDHSLVTVLAPLQARLRLRASNSRLSHVVRGPKQAAHDKLALDPSLRAEGKPTESSRSKVRSASPRTTARAQLARSF